MASPFSNQGSAIDTFLNSNEPTTNHYSATDIQVGEWNAGAAIARTLIKWDLSSIPADATVTSATLSIWTQSDASDNTRTIRAYRVLRTWVETQATWNAYSTGNNWGTAGCANTSTDREATDIGSVSVAHNLAADTEVAISLTPAEVQEWISGALTNNGVLIQADTETNDLWTYDSTQGGDAIRRPKLVIAYTLPEAPGIINFI